MHMNAVFIIVEFPTMGIDSFKQFKLYCEGGKWGLYNGTE